MARPDLKQGYFDVTWTVSAPRWVEELDNRFHREYLAAPVEARALDKTPKETPLMQVRTQTARTKAGTVGQVLNPATGDIVWESSPFASPLTDTDGRTLKGVGTLAIDAADAKVADVLKGLFA
jgi:hypothetical protein